MATPKKQIKTISDLSPSPDMFVYANTRDAAARLNNVILRINDEPCFIDNVTEGDLPLVHYSPCDYAPRGGNKKPKVVALKDLPKVASLRNLTLGYINMPYDAYYLRRIAAQTTKQSVCLNHIAGLPEERFSEKLTSFKDMFNNVYPSFEEAKEELLSNEDEIQGRAFHKHFKLKYLQDMEEIVLEYKGYKIGIMTDNKKAIRLSRKMSWLKETLEEENIPYA